MQILGDLFGEYDYFVYFCGGINVIKIMMETLTIAFDDRKLLSVIKELVNSMSGVRIVQHTHSEAKQEKQVSVSVNSRYRISPIIKAMETGVSIPDSISDNYKNEIGEIRTQRYLWVTRNIRDFFLSDIPVLSPDEAIDIIDNNHSI